MLRSSNTVLWKKWKNATLRATQLQVPYKLWFLRLLDWLSLLHNLTSPAPWDRVTFPVVFYMQFPVVVPQNTQEESQIILWFSSWDLADQASFSLHMPDTCIVRLNKPPESSRYSPVRTFGVWIPWRPLHFPWTWKKVSTLKGAPFCPTSLDEKHTQ